MFDFNDNDGLYKDIIIIVDLLVNGVIASKIFLINFICIVLISVAFIYRFSYVKFMAISKTKLFTFRFKFRIILVLLNTVVILT